MRADIVVEPEPGSDDPPTPESTPTALSITGAQSPNNKAAMTFPNIYKVRELDLTNVSRVYWDIGGTAKSIILALPENNAPTANCSNLAGCTIFSGPDLTGQNPSDVDYTVGRLTIIPEDWSLFLTKNGITTISGTSDRSGSQAMPSDYEEDYYGGWMDYSGFGVFNTTVTGSYNGKAQLGMATGDKTGRVPSDSYDQAKWSGLMVGTPTSGTNKGDRLQGDTEITYTFHKTSPYINADFTNIKNIDKVQDHSTATVSLIESQSEPMELFHNQTATAAMLFKVHFTHTPHNGREKSPVFSTHPKWLERSAPNMSRSR